MYPLSAAPATLILLIVNVLVSVYALFLDPSLIERFSFRPKQILVNREYFRLLSAGFVHVGIAHLAFNMFTLYFFGPYLEVRLGTPSFLILYFGSELAAHGLSLFLHQKNESYAAVGASGAISGVVFGFCLFEPFAILRIFFIPVDIPAYLFAIGYVVISILAMRRAQQDGFTGGIAHEAHLGGALGGLLLTILLEPGVIQGFLNEFGL
jgi:membrane associated rhomboid family serine protease